MLEITKKKTYLSNNQINFFKKNNLKLTDISF